MPLFIRPEFEVTFESTPPFVDMTWARLGEGSNSVCDFHNWHIEIWNRGQVAAKEVQVVLQRAYEYEEVDGKWVHLAQLPPVNLRWSYSGELRKQFIPRSRSAMCHLCEIGDPSKINFEMKYNTEAAILELKVAHKFQNQSHLLTPGIYRLVLVVFAENANPQEFVLQVQTTGAWEDVDFQPGIRTPPTPGLFQQEVRLAKVSTTGQAIL